MLVDWIKKLLHTRTRRLFAIVVLTVVMVSSAFLVMAQEPAEPPPTQYGDANGHVTPEDYVQPPMAVGFLTDKIEMMNRLYPILTCPACAEAAG